MSSSENFGQRVSTWQSLVALPLWVKVWLLILGCANIASLAFLWQPSGVLVAALVFNGIILSKVAVIYSGGLSRLVGIGHIVGWTPLVLMLAFARPEASGAYDVYLTLLLVVNSISLIFDFNDLRLWLNGDRAVFA